MTVETTTRSWIKSRSATKNKMAWVTYGKVEALRFELDPEGEATITAVTKHMSYEAKKALGQKYGPSPTTLQVEHRVCAWVIRQGGTSLLPEIPFNRYEKAAGATAVTLKDLLKNPDKYKPATAGTKGGNGVVDSTLQAADSYAKSILTGLMGYHDRATNEAAEAEGIEDWALASKRKTAATEFLAAHAKTKAAYGNLFLDE